MTDDELVRCPNGHQVRRADLVVREGKLICPACTAGGWTPPAPRTWSRSALAAPLWLLFVGEVMAALGDLSGLSGYRESVHLTVSTGAQSAYIWSALGHAVIAVGAAIAGVVVRRP